MQADRLQEHLLVLERLPELQRRLQAAGSPAEVVSRAANMAIGLFDFDRAVILRANADALTAAGLLPLSDGSSDRLRRKALTVAIPLAGASPDEAGAGSPLAGVVGAALDLGCFVCCPVRLGSTFFGMLVVDRPTGRPEPDLLERAGLMAFAAAVSFALEHVAVRSRLDHLRSELRYLMASGQSLIGEALADPAMPFERRHVGLFPHGHSGAGETAGYPVLPTFVARERAVLDLLVEGLSNRDIAEQLMISSETVKDYVARIMRKLEASNRVEAVSRYLRLIHDSKQ